MIKLFFSLTIIINEQDDERYNELWSNIICQISTLIINIEHFDQTK